MEEHFLTDALRPVPECPSIERLGRYADGALTPEERRHDESHLATCANCQAELALLHAFAAPLVRDDEADVVRWGVDQLRRRESELFDRRQPPDSSIRGWFSAGSLRPAMVLATVLLAVVAGYYLTSPGPPPLPANIGSSPEATRSLSVTVRSPIGDQPTVPVRLQWLPVGGAARYHVRLSEVDRRELWSSDTVETAVDLPADVRARIVPGKTLVWQVTAIGASNTPIAESNAERFRLVP